MRSVPRMILAAALMLALLLTAATVGLAATTTTTPSRIAAGPAPVAVSTTQVTAKVVGVSQSARTVTLQMPNGTMVTYKVPAEVRNFSQIKRGDTVRATVVQSVAVYVQKSGARPTATETQTVTLAPRGARPAMIRTSTIRITGRVQSVDTRNRTITIIGPANRSRTLMVGPNVDMRSIRPGEDIVLRYTEATALELQKTTR